MKKFIFNLVVGFLLLFANCSSPYKSSCNEAILLAALFISNPDKFTNTEYTPIILLIAVKSQCDPNYVPPTDSNSSAKITNKEEARE